jgi:hypothetical protein
VLANLRELLASDGLLIFSAHNLAFIDRQTGAGRRGALLSQLAHLSLAELVKLPARIPRRMRNRRRLTALEHRGADYALVNDEAHDYGLLHYYIGRDAQARQLAEVALELVECVDPDGGPVPEGGTDRWPWLFYVARTAVT